MIAVMHLLSRFAMFSKTNCLNKLISKTGWPLNQDTINRKVIWKHNKQMGQGSACDNSVEAEILLHTFKIFGVHSCV
jgi:hypothetical protein